MMVTSPTATAMATLSTRQVGGALSQHIAAQLQGALPQARLWQRPDEGEPA